MNPKLIDETLRELNRKQQLEIAKLKNELRFALHEITALRNQLIIVEKSVDRATYPHQKKSS